MRAVYRRPEMRDSLVQRLRAEGNVKDVEVEWIRADAALRLVQELRGEIDLLLTDMVLSLIHI